MSGKSTRVPQAGRHKATGQSVVRLNGRDFYLGQHKSAGAKAEYNRLISEWLANGRQIPQANSSFLVAELIVAYVHHAKAYYSKGGDQTSEYDIIHQAMRWLRQSHARVPVAEFGPKAFKAIRQRMIDGKLSRHTINSYMGCIRRCFRWGVEQEIVPSSVFHGLQAVAGLKQGRSDARETKPVRPVAQHCIDAVIPFVAPQVAAMIRFQLLTGSRPGEACTIRSADIEMSGSVWVYRPQGHKTEHHGHQREIFIGPKAQEIIRPWLRPELEAYLFQPREVQHARQLERRRNRKSAMTPSQAARRRKRRPQRAPRDCYSVASYRRAISRACEQAFEMPDCLRKPDRELPKQEIARCRLEANQWRAEHCWHPHQLRHNAGTNLRKEHGVEVARIILGHSTAFTTEIYAEADKQQAVEVIAKVG